MPYLKASLCLFSLLVWTLHVNSSEDEIRVIFKADMYKESINLTCYVSELGLDVKFIDPHEKKRAECEAPVPLASYKPECKPKAFTTQDIEENYTRFMISPITVKDFGIWKCQHGTNKGSSFVAVFRPVLPSDNEAESDSCGIAIAITVVLLIIIFIFLWNFKKIIAAIDRFKMWCSKGQDGDHAREDEMELLKQDDTEESTSKEEKSAENCSICCKDTRFCFCYECSKSFCEICEKMHLRAVDNHNHHIMQFYNSQESKEKSKDAKLECQVCQNDKRFVEKVCFKCTAKHAKCLECKCEHETNPSNSLKVLMTYTTKIEKQASEKVLKKTSIDLTIPNPRIRSLALLNEDGVIVTDFCQTKLIYYNGKEKKDESKLTSEPRGLVRIDRLNSFAVTFGYEHKIRFYEIRETTSKISEYKKPLKVIGHPFQIAHHKGLFAIEMNEGSDGEIVIMDAENDRVKTTIKNENYTFGFFTGNSLRLALNKDKEDIYVSAIGKQTFYCLGFDGKIKWQIQISSPRSVVEIPGDDKLDTKILLASRLSNTIFLISCKKEKGESESYNPPSVEALYFDELTNPDFMDYHTLTGNDKKQHKYLTVEVERFKVHVYEMPSL